MFTATTDPTPQEQAPILSNLLVRAISAFTLIPIVLGSMIAGGWVWVFMVAIVMVIGLLEFYILAHGRQSQGSAMVGIPTGLAVLVSFATGEPFASVAAVLVGCTATFILETIRHPGDLRRTRWQVLTTMGGVLYVAFPLTFLAATRNLPDGILWVLVIFALTWGTDTFAYFGGRFLGKHKLAPKLSPKKTLEGAVVGVVGGIACALLLLVPSGHINAATLVWIAIAPFIAILGDLFESALKRYFHVKDSHVRGLNVIPGHGGVLDRIDALLLVSAFSYALIVLTQLAA